MYGQIDQSEMTVRDVEADDEMNVDALRIRLEEEHQRRVFFSSVCTEFNSRFFGDLGTCD